MLPLVPVVTTTLGARPDIAAAIKLGYESSHYERVGGVIRHADNKRIVAWLRDMGTLSPDSALLRQLGPLTQLAAATSVINLSVTVITFAIVMKRLNAIESKLNEISKLLEEINRKLDLSFYANFRAALELARSAFVMQDERNRRASAMQSIDRFLAAEYHYLGLLDAELDAEGLAAAPFLNTLTLAYISVAKCYLELEEVKTARQHLQEGSQALSSRVERFYNSVIEVNPAIYLHPDLADDISL